MATATTTLQVTRGDSIKIVGALTPATGGAFATPIASLTFTAKAAVTDSVAAITKSVGSGVVIAAQSSTSITYEVTLDPDDTDDLPARETRLIWDVELVENDGWTSTPIGGVLVVRPDVTI